MRLEVEPELGRHAKIASQTQGGVGGDSALAVYNFIDASRWHGDVLCNPILRNAEWHDEFLVEDFAGVDWWKFFSHRWVNDSPLFLFHRHHHYAR